MTKLSRLVHPCTRYWKHERTDMCGVTCYNGGLTVDRTKPKCAHCGRRAGEGYCDWIECPGLSLPTNPRPWETAVLPQRDPNPPRIIRSVFGSDTETLNFHTEQEYREYETNIRNAKMLAYHTMRMNYGIWAGNQNKYVQTVEELTHWDGGHKREAEYQEWLRNGGANGST